MVKHTPAPVGGRRKTMKKGGRKSRRVASKKTRKGVKKGRSRRVRRRGGADEEKMKQATEIVKAYLAYNGLFNDRLREERGLPYDKGADAEKTKAKIARLMQEEEAAKTAYDTIWENSPDDVRDLFDEARERYVKELRDQDEAAAEEGDEDERDYQQEEMEAAYYDAARR